MRMFDIEVKVKKLSEKAIIPSYSREGDAGLDLYTSEDIIIEAGETVLVPTDIAMEIPFGHEGTVRPRSGNSLNGVKGCKKLIPVKNKNLRGFTVEKIVEIDNVKYAIISNMQSYLRVQLGTVDSNYRGSIGIITYNQENHKILIPKGTKLAQIVISPIDYCEIKEVDELEETNRGNSGFGSSGHRIN